MIRTKSIVDIMKEIPSTWLFEYYCELKEKLCGQDLMILSPFNPKDKIPSMSIFFDKRGNRYRFCDHSGDKKGDGVDLVRYLYSLGNTEAVAKVVTDYEEFIEKYGESGFTGYKEYSRYKVTDFLKRKWNTLDKRYWSEYDITSKELEEDMIFPLESYLMEKEELGEHKQICIVNNNIYGFFREDGSMYKIYQPKIKDKKFIKIKSYIQGTDQLRFTKPYLVITSSMKDRRCLLNMNFNLESVAPDSENTMIKPGVMTMYKTKYRNVVTLFDNDEAGVKAMKRYEDEHQTPGVLLNLEKDVSDSVKKYSSAKVKEMLYPLLCSALKPKRLEVV